MLSEIPPGGTKSAQDFPSFFNPELSSSVCVYMCKQTIVWGPSEITLTGHITVELKKNSRSGNSLALTLLQKQSLFCLAFVIGNCCQLDLLFRQCDGL